VRGRLNNSKPGATFLATCGGLVRVRIALRAGRVPLAYPTGFTLFTVRVRRGLAPRGRRACSGFHVSAARPGASSWLLRARKEAGWLDGNRNNPVGNNPGLNNRDRPGEYQTARPRDVCTITGMPTPRKGKPPAWGTLARLALGFRLRRTCRELTLQDRRQNNAYAFPTRSLRFSLAAGPGAASRVSWSVSAFAGRVRTDSSGRAYFLLLLGKIASPVLGHPRGAGEVFRSSPCGYEE
jgi:hypothetical protein